MILRKFILTIGKIFQLIPFVFLCGLLTFPPSLSAAHSETLVVGVYQNNPLVFWEADETPKGLMIDIVEELASTLNWKIEYKNCSWGQCLTLLQQGKIDMLVAIGYSDERALLYDFTKENILSNWGEIYTTSRSKVNSLLQLNGSRIAVLEGDIYAIALKHLLKKFSINATLTYYQEYSDVLLAVQSQAADCGVVNRLFGLKKASQFAVKRSPIVFNPIELRFAFTKGKYRHLITEIDDRLKKMKNNPQSAYHRAINKWIEQQPVHSQIPRIIKIILVLMCTILIGVILLSYIFKRQVIARTSELSAKNVLLEEEISRRKQSEEELRISLSEKEILLREVHHRVKNNLQLVSSLIGLQATSIDAADARTKLMDLKQRIRSMAMIYDDLYQVESLATIDLSQYIRRLSSSLYALFNVDPQRVELQVHTEQASIPLEKAVPCSLILNELLSNALKYAFPDKRSGKIIITLRWKSAGVLALRVSDDGIGGKGEREKERPDQPLGLSIVSMLVEQIDGSMNMETKQGTTIDIEFLVCPGVVPVQD